MQSISHDLDLVEQPNFRRSPMGGPDHHRRVRRPGERRAELA
jgi:hypothetical protein